MSENAIAENLKLVEAAAVENADAKKIEAKALAVGPSGKPGWQTSEFWLAIAMLAAGLYLMAKGKDELGTILVGASGLGHLTSRTIVKAQA